MHARPLIRRGRLIPNLMRLLLGTLSTSLYAQPVASPSLAQSVSTACSESALCLWLLISAPFVLGFAAGIVLWRWLSQRQSTQQQQLAEQRVVQYKNFLNTVLQSIPHPVYVRDRDGRFIMVNAAMCAFSNQDEQSMIGTRRDDQLFLHADVAAKVRAMDERVFATAQPQTAEYDLLIRGRGLRSIISSKTLAVDPEGQPILIGTLTDVTEKGRAERAILQTSRDLQAVLDAATEVSIISTDTSGMIRIFNQGAEKMLGYSAREMIELQSMTVIHLASEVQQRSAELSAELKRPVNAFETFTILPNIHGAEHREWTYVRKNRSQTTVDLVVTAVRQHDGVVCGYLGIAIDITDRKKAEAELFNHQENLLELVAEKTASLQRAKDAAEKADNAKTEFLANMTHELRTPLHAILSFATLGQEKAKLINAGQSIEKFEHYFRRICQSGALLLRLFDTLLDLAKLEAGKMCLSLTRQNVQPLIRDACAEFESLLEERGIKLLIQPTDLNTEAIIDAMRFSQVIRNLLSNAIKFSPDQGAIDISFAHGSVPAGRRTHDDTALPALSIVIADEGIGIPEDELEIIFEKFVQSSKTKNGAGATGLGLSICREIMHAHRGTIVASNNPAPKHGASFTIQLPTVPNPFTHAISSENANYERQDPHR
ncbi:MAG: ATP-binding protein [Pseudomonadota bacterium]